MDTRHPDLSRGDLVGGLEKVPCQDIIPIGKDDLQVNATVVVDGTSYANPVSTDHDLVKALDKDCYLKH